MKTPIVLAVALVLVVLLTAAVAWYDPFQRRDRMDALTQQAQAACLANSDAERKGAVSASGEQQGAGLKGSAEVGSRVVSKLGASDKTPASQVIDEQDRIRKCIADFIDAREARR